MRALRLVSAAGLAALGLAGCSTVDPTMLATTSAPATLGAAVPPERALASLPPEAGAVVSVVERRGPDDEVRQTVTLAGDPAARGVDRIEVTARPKAFAGAAAPRIDAETIEAEMAEAFPDVAMTVSPRVLTTPTGPVGVATGRGGDGVGCLYAWSNAETRPRSGGGASLLGVTVSTTTTSNLSIRVRLCRKGFGEERLIALASGLRVASDLAAPGLAAGSSAVGGDALASAGYGAAAPAPAIPAPTPVADRRPSRPAVAAKPHATPRPTVAAAEPAPKAPPPLEGVAPIPLPTGG